jgi:hypothetical protein
MDPDRRAVHGSGCEEVCAWCIWPGGAEEPTELSSGLGYDAYARGEGQHTRTGGRGKLLATYTLSGTHVFRCVTQTPAACGHAGMTR